MTKLSQFLSSQCKKWFNKFGRSYAATLLPPPIEIVIWREGEVRERVSVEGRERGGGGGVNHKP